MGPDPPDAGLRREDVRRLASAGFEIGFHTRGHYKLPPLPDVDLDRVLREGRTELEEAAGREITTIAYPHGAADERVTRFARAAGYELGFTTRMEVAAPETDPLRIGRTDVGAMSIERFPATLAALASSAPAHS